MRQFSAPHLAALAVLVVATGGSVWLARRHPGGWLRALRVGLAALIFAGWAGEYVADAILGTWSVKYTLPLQLTDLISVTAILALLTGRRLLVELTYFWAFTATLQATLTPDLGQSFPSIYYFTYFIYHIGAIVAAALLVFGCRCYPRPGAAWRVFALTLGWAAVAGSADAITGGNYMYLRTKPAHASLLSLLGPWPWWIAAAAVVAVAMLYLLDALTRAIRAAVDPGHPMSHRWRDHTAELELEIEAATPEAVFTEAAAALGGLLEGGGDESGGREGEGDRGGDGPAVRYEVSLAGSEPALLLADWLDELVFRAETELVVPRAVERLELSATGLEAVIRGVRGEPRPLVKGVTHHRLALEPSARGYRARVVLDV
jgi:hypothetical integral membrane protein (TIGR02206 family)